MAGWYGLASLTYLSVDRLLTGVAGPFISFFVRLAQILPTGECEKSPKGQYLSPSAQVLFRPLMLYG